MSVIGKLLESGRKRPREEEASSSTTCFSPSSEGGGSMNATQKRNATYDLNKRADELSSEISVLYNKFPEMNLIMDSKTLLAHVVTAVEEAEAEVTREAKKCYHEEETVPYNSLPDEVLQNCLSYVGKGHYGLVGLASKKLCKAYVEAFGQETAYLEMATSVKLVNHCFEDLCKNLSEKDEILKAAAVNGNLDILRNAISRGYDLFPLVEIKKEDTYEYY
ncbi:predicted protein [Chaetoceros tenuissimus]|uniref:Uncharacterized protein n=1 Tax=Chaetoceros tenuissimus TaxID=426638 RepID=A0AAD3HA24_9STRA|nr:predicted protein [Chaetoceros tenuissimus]